MDRACAGPWWYRLGVWLGLVEDDTWRCCTVCQTQVRFGSPLKPRIAPDRWTCPACGSTQYQEPM